MGVSKIKNLVIASLVLVNIFFLTFLIVDKISSYRAQREITEDVCAVLVSGGIQITPGNITQTGELKSLKTVRSFQQERTIAESVLGESAMSDRGGNIYQYESENGLAVFDSTGSFTINVTSGMAATADVRDFTLELLRNMTHISPAGIDSTLEDGIEIVTVSVAARGAVIFNCFVRFVYTNGYLTEVSGRYAPGITSDSESDVQKPVSAALLLFLASVKKGGISCTRIDLVQSGYISRDLGVFGDGSLKPVWLISCDSGRYIADAETGEIEPAPSAL